MARSLSNMVFKGLIGSTHSLKSKVASGSVFQQGLKYSTGLGGDSDTHEDFLPTNKVESSGSFLQDTVTQDIKENPVMVYMKGYPEAPQCGFSALAVKVLQQYRVPISSRNILEDPQLKEAIKRVSNWPTFPQIFIKGEFIGGSDIVLTMHQNGELKEKLDEVKSDGKES